MSDLISRQAAIDELVKMLGYCFQADEEVLDAVVTTVRELPPAELSTNLAEVGTDGISRQQVIGALRNYLVGKNVPCDGTLTCRLIENEVISKLPSAQPKKGRWISADAMFGGVPFYCSECGENTRDTVMGKPRWKFCPMCGSRNEVTE